jgi:hypothetical protein
MLLNITSMFLTMMLISRRANHGEGFLAYVMKHTTDVPVNDVDRCDAFLQTYKLQLCIGDISTLE